MSALSSTEPRELAHLCLDALERRGFAKGQVRVVAGERHELSAEVGRINLLRTTHDTRLALRGIVDGKSGTVSLNKSEPHAIAGAVQDLWAATMGSAPDTAYDIAPGQPGKRFERGPVAPRREAMVERLAEFLDYARTTYPTVVMRQAVVDFVAREECVANSNGVEFTGRRNHYGAVAMFSAREGTAQSSMNYSRLSLDELDGPLHVRATFDRLLAQCTEQVRTRKVPAKFTGDLVIAPDCLDSFVGFLLQGISNLPLIAGTSLYKDRLGKQVVSAAMTISSRPLEMPGGYFVTDDGFEADNVTVVDKGTLCSYLVDQYGANKTGLSRARTGGDCWVVDAGAIPLAQMIRDVKQGLLITRFSGGRPNDKGDFSGIAKNSYYIEGGEVKFPVSEAMVSGNLDRLLNQVVAVSKERADFGDRIYPWVRATGVGVS